jgi:hypothetical protein
LCQCHEKAHSNEGVESHVHMNEQVKSPVGPSWVLPTPPANGEHQADMSWCVFWMLFDTITLMASDLSRGQGRAG